MIVNEGTLALCIHNFPTSVLVGNFAYKFYKKKIMHTYLAKVGMVVFHHWLIFLHGFLMVKS